MMKDSCLFRSRLSTINDFFFFLLYRAAPEAYGGSQAWGPIGATAASLHGIGTKSVNYTTAHDSAGSLTH